MRATAKRGKEKSARSRASLKRVAKKLAKAPPRKRRRRVRKPASRIYHPGPLIDGEAALAVGVAALAAQDPEAIAHMLEIGGPTPLRRREPGFEGLAAIIVSQQVSTASANAIFGRLHSMVSPLDAANLLATSEDTLRAAGLSAPKIRGLRAVAEAVATKALDIDALASMTAEEAHAKLVAVKGIGPWTADIFLLFCLGHPDAWPAGDLALQEAARLALNMKKRPDTMRLEKIGERWRPWRGVAARMLWAYYRARKAGRAGMSLE
ncbi:MAG: DNA-3-methyladenine glycosylase 2 family protein [Methylobacteriaceae bacterium]|nr:DNA-3-methyladenine glycosylase 2 family protein [Methylobacteriaceae bacterium]